MKFSFEQLGFIEQGEVTLGDLTLICGPNNMGKTYVSHAIYGLLKMAFSFPSSNVPDFVSERLRDKGFARLDLVKAAPDLTAQISKSCSEVFSAKVSQFFSVSEQSMAKTNINLFQEQLMFDLSTEVERSLPVGKESVIYISKPASSSVLTLTLKTQSEDSVPTDVLNKFISQELSHVFASMMLPPPFVITSERTGAAFFQHELRTVVSEFDQDAQHIVQVHTRYPLPVCDNIQAVRDFTQLNKQQSFIAKDPELHYVLEALNDLLGGSFNSNNESLVYEINSKGGEKVSVPVTVASSSVKSLFLIDLYIKCVAVPKGILIIDEPELNLHPDNQRKMAGLLARLVNAGVKVVVTTHSDYLVREINNRIMLSGEVEDKEAIMADAGMVEQDILQQEQVKAYIVKDDRKIHDVEVDKYGINMKVFDQLIADANDLADRIYYGIKD